MNRNNSIDGFGVRRRPQNSNISRQRSAPHNREVPERFLINPARGTGAPRPGGAPVLNRAGGQGVVGGNPLSLPKPLRHREKLGLDLSIDDSASGGGSRGKKSKKGGSKRFFGKPSRKKIIMIIVSLLLIALLAFGGYFLYKFLIASGKIFKGNVITALFDQGRPLQQDENGRSNILLFGTSEDDPGHPGGELTDSIMVVSVDQNKKDAFVVSIPRDLHVKYEQGSCGYQGKINVVYKCAKDMGGEDVGSAALREKAGEVLGLDIQYSAHVNYTVMREAVDAVGGITVNIESDDPRGILDRNFDWTCNYKCYFVKYPNGPVQLDGVHALALARARGEGGETYGLSRSNPDRQDNQRKILIALKDKAVSAGVLANPVAVNGLLDTLGNNLRTNFAAEEIKTLLDLGNTVKTESIVSFSLENEIKPLATASCFNGDICPNAGNFDYSDIHAAIKALSTGNTAALEYANIAVFNASGTPGLAQAEADKLETKGFTIGLIGNAPASLGTQPLQFYDLSGGKKPATLKMLKELFGVEAVSGRPTGISVGSSDFAVIVGPQPQ